MCEIDNSKSYSKKLSEKSLYQNNWDIITEVTTFLNLFRKSQI